MPTDPVSVQTYDQQVAGHNKMEDTKYLGLLQCTDGTILKPILKPSQKREVEFYERCTNSSEADLVELRKYVPKYHGCRKYTYNGYEQEYIVMEQLTTRILEPCVMDIKIGKRTWDPLASEEKKMSEMKKYSTCKQEYSFCIPGYQVHRISTGKLLKYNKEYGKKLFGSMVRDAFRNYLNGTGTNMCRALILQFLSELWKIQKWASRQTTVHLYSASLLLVYDASRLRECCSSNDVLPSSKPKCHSSNIPHRRHSVSTSSGSSFSGQLSPTGPVYKKVSSVPTTSISLGQSMFAPSPSIQSPWTEALERLHHNHSFEHNYEDKLSKIKMNYKAILDQLTSDSPYPNPWGTVKIIDFAHAFFNEDDERCVDSNFKEGIDSVVRIFESFLTETNDQVF